jgi:hypothetical protein
VQRDRVRRVEHRQLGIEEADLPGLPLHLESTVSRRSRP